MRLVSFLRPDGQPSWGLHHGDRVLDVPARLCSPEHGDRSTRPPATLLALLRAGEPALEQVRDLAQRIAEEADQSGRLDHSHGEEEIVWRPPVPEARLISMRGNNPILLRLDGLTRPAFPTLTPRHPAGLIGHRENVILRPQDGAIGWGAEFVAVLGTTVRDADARQAHSAVLGYTVTNDLSGSCFATSVAPDLDPRDYTYRDEHFAGKFYGTWSMPQAVGPWITTVDDVSDPYHLTVGAYENGVACDIVTTASMLFGFDDMISFLSRFMTLRPGDMISSGALGYHMIDGLETYPEGSGFRITVESVGSLVNPIVDRRGAAR